MDTAQIPGRAIPGWLADRWGRFNVMILSSLPCAIIILTVWLPANTAGSIIAFSVLFGLLSGTANRLTPVCISQLCRTEDYGSRYGTAYLFVSSATLIGIPIAGAVLGSNGGRNFRGLILLCGFVCGLQSIYHIGKDIRGWMEVEEVFSEYKYLNIYKIRIGNSLQIFVFFKSVSLERSIVY
jgi:MFS family permease